MKRLFLAVVVATVTFAGTAPAPAAITGRISKYSRIPGRAEWGKVSIRFGATTWAQTTANPTAGIQPEGHQTLCIQIRDDARKRFEVGCGPVTISVDPLLRSVTIAGSVPSTVRVLNQSTRVASSTIAFRADLTEAGDLKRLPWGYTSCVRTDDRGSTHQMTTIGFARPMRGPVSMRSAYLGRYTSKPISQGVVESWDSTWIGLPVGASASTHCV